MFIMLAATALVAFTPDPAARALLDTALTRMGGAAAFESIHRIRYEFITQWQVPTWDERPYADRPSYERHVDVRDYTINAWRNTREFHTPSGWQAVVEVVRGDVGMRSFGGRKMPLNIAYIDERDEMFAYSADRLLLGVRAAPDLRILPDTNIGGIAHARVAATLNDAPAVLCLQRGDGLPAVLRMRAAHPNDFGLVPFGVMEVEVWYSNWQPFANGDVLLPSQWDVTRAGRPYKRLTILAATINPGLAADSFAMSDSIRSLYRAQTTKPMHDLPLDSARGLEGAFVEFRTFGMPAGAVKVGDAWLLLETGQAPLSAQRAVEWLQLHYGKAPLYAIIGDVLPGNGGLAHLVRAGVPVAIAPGFDAMANAVLAGHSTKRIGVSVVNRGTWLRVGGDSVRIESIDLPNARGTLMLWVPSLRWLYAPGIVTPLDRTLVLERARRAAWQVDRIGSLKQLLSPITKDSVN